MRLISLVPSYTEILYALGLGDYTIGVTAHCDFPFQATRKQWIGTFARPEVAKIISLRPDFVFADSIFQKKVIEELRERGVTVYDFAPRTLDQLLNSMDEIIRMTGRGEASKAVVNLLRVRVAAFRKAVEGLQKPKVIFIMGEDPLTTPGPASCQYDVLKAIGASLMSFEDHVTYAFISWEDIVNFDPDVILACGRPKGEPPKNKCLGCDIENRPCIREVESILNHPALAEVSAVKKGQVHTIPCHWLCRPGPRLVDGMEALLPIIHKG